MKLTGLHVSSDGGTRMHAVSVDGVPKIRIERRGLTQAFSGRPAKEAWYHVVDARTPAEVARHVDLADMQPMETP